MILLPNKSYFVSNFSKCSFSVMSHTYSTKLNKEYGIINSYSI